MKRRHYEENITAHETLIVEVVFFPVGPLYTYILSFPQLVAIYLERQKSLETTVR